MSSRLGNGQSTLDLDDEVIEAEEAKKAIKALPHILFVHGHQSLKFAHLAVPSSTSSVRYLWRSDNLMNLPHEVSKPGPAAEDTDYDLNEMKLLKERIEKWRRDNDRE